MTQNRWGPWLYVPIAGPVIYLAEAPSYKYGGSAPVIIVDAVGQALGVAMLAFGIAGRDVLVRNASARVTIAPTLAGASRGLSVVGTF